MFWHLFRSALTHAVRRIRELEQLVSDAAPGDEFTYLSVSFLPLASYSLAFNVDSGNSDQQPSFDDIDEEEDGQDDGMPYLILIRAPLT